MAESVLHFGSFTIRVDGSGLLRATLFGFNKVKSYIARPITMAPAATIEPVRLTNFNAQRAILRIETTAINETFDINRIVIWVKPVATQYPSSMSA